MPLLHRLNRDIEAAAAPALTALRDGLAAYPSPPPAARPDTRARASLPPFFPQRLDDGQLLNRAARPLPPGICEHDVRKLRQHLNPQRNVPQGSYPRTYRVEPADNPQEARQDC
jgi:hypothetical protein